MIISMKLTITDLAEQKPMFIFLVSDVCAVPLVGEVICHSLNVNKVLRPKALFRATWKAYIKLDYPVHYRQRSINVHVRSAQSCRFLSALSHFW